MRRLLAIALSLIAFSAQADHAASEPRLTDGSKLLRVQILGEALRNKDITQEQYQQSVSWVNSTPCDGVDRRLEAQKQPLLEVAIAKEQEREKIKVFDSFKSDGWFILFVNVGVGDTPYLFYSEDPLKGSHPVAIWSGAAIVFETSEVAQWVKENAKGIPARLANCFAWHVTLSSEVRND